MASERSGWSTTQVMLAFLAGAAAGAVAAWALSTPSGAAARRRVKDAAGAAADKVRSASGDMQSALRRAAGAARDAFDEAMTTRRD